MAREKQHLYAQDRSLRAEEEHSILLKWKREFESEACKSAELEYKQDTGIYTRAAINHAREFLKTRAGQELRFISINPQQP